MAHLFFHWQIMSDSSSRKTFYWIRESKSCSSNGKRTVWKGFTFSFHTRPKMATSAFIDTHYIFPIFTKAFPCPFNLDQKRLLKVKQLVWTQNRPLLKHKIQIFSAHQFIIHGSTYPSHDLLENGASNEIISPREGKEARQSFCKEKKVAIVSNICSTYA